MEKFGILKDVANAQHRGKDFAAKKVKLANQPQQPRAVFNDLTNANGVHRSKRVKLNSQEEKIKTLDDEDIESNLNLDCLKLVGKENVNCMEVQELSIPSSITSVDEYGSDIWKYLYHLETTTEWPKPNYMTKQKDLNDQMRSVLVDWLVSVAEEYKMEEHTLHLSINYIDRFLSSMSVVRDKFQLLGIAALMVAMKIEEVNLLETDEWAFLSGTAYTVHQITRMEQLLLKVLKFDVNPPTMMSFIRQLCTMHSLDKKTLHAAMYICELVLLEGGPYLEYVPSKLAAAAVVLARYMLFKKNPCFKRLQITSGYSFKQLSPVLMRQYRSVKDSPNKEQQAIQTKYKGEKYDKVSLITPRTLFLDGCEDN